MANDLNELKFDYENKSMFSIAWELLKKSEKVAILFIIVASLITYSIFFITIISALLSSSRLIEYFEVIDYVNMLLYLGSPIFAIYGLLYHKGLGFFVKRFAEKNGLDYQDSDQLNSLSNSFSFSEGERSIKYVVSGLFKDHPTRFFVLYGGRKKFLVWETKFEKVDFPHILLQSKKMSRLWKKDKNETKVSLSNKFSDKFDLYVTSGYEIEVLQIFTPEVLQILSDKNSEFSIEFVDRCMYVYDNNIVKNGKQLKEIFDVARSVFDSAGLLINRLHDDFDVMHKYYAER